ncbi:serine/threonine-protein kinase GIN4 [Macrophomina phaseolina]|uniref:non-specific serine/threonine protein kinase n=1 Tax=Macrophomina phaseolina TaxID=35725 RepID=A0ABQ8GV80_9PEZI|nr:serine/threonine-protein kinase GIN4 [Macrophomina phaseolina]
MERSGRPSRYSSQKSRRPLTDATSRANSSTPPRSTKASTKHGEAQYQLFHNESLLPQGDTPTVHRPTSTAENKHPANVAKIDSRAVNRDSAVSNLSNSSGRKTHIGPWQLGKTIGEGGCSRVRAVRHCVTGQLGAAKIISKKTADKVKAQSLLNLYKSAETDPKLAAQMKIMPFGLEREIVIMKLLNHSNIVKLFDVWENRSELYLIMEYVEGGELFGYIDESVGLPEMETVFIFRQIVAALLYCHRIKIHHRDLKPENILIDAENLTIKLVDFGMAALQPEGRWLSTPCGSPHYAAPEVIRYKQYDGGQADVWSCGVILYVMLTGQPPFTYNDRQDLTHLFKMIAQARYVMPDNLSDEAKDLISKILVPDPRRRINIEGVWKHPFLHKYDAEFGFDERTDKDIWNGPKPRISHWDLRHAEDVDKETLRNMRCLWHSEPEENIMRRLMNNEANQEKFFYSSLQKYKEQQLEHWPGEPEIAYSASDYHHIQPLTRPGQSHPLPHARTKSQFSILNDEHLHTAHSFQKPPPSEKSYDPFRASREPSIANKGNYMNVTVHRHGTVESVHRNRRSSVALSSSHGRGSSLRVETLKKSGWRTSGLSSIDSRGSSRRGSVATPTAKHKKSLSRSSTSSSVWASSPPIVVRPSGSHKRGVSFAHLRKSSTTGRLTVTEATLAQCTPEQRKYLQEATEERRPQEQVPELPSSPAQTCSLLASSGFVLKNAKPRLKAKPPETPGRVIDGEIRKASVELEKALDEAFNRSSVSSSVRTSSERPNPFEYETPPSSVSYRGSGASAYTADAQALKQIDTQRPLPPLPPEASHDSPNTYLARELAETRERLAARFALEGGENTANYNEALSSLDRLLHPARLTPADGNHRSVSAPQQQSPQHPRLLPIISEEGKSTPDASPQVGAPNWRTVTRAATDPVSRAQDWCHGYQTIRVVDASSPGPDGPHIPPLNIRKKSSGSTLAQVAAATELTPTPPLSHAHGLQPTVPATPSPVNQLRHKASRITGLGQAPSPIANRNSLDAATQTTPAQTPPQTSTPSTTAKEEKVTKKRSWFKRRASDKDQPEPIQYTTDFARRPRIPDAWQGLDDRLERPKPRAVSSYAKPDRKTNASPSASSNSEFPMRDSEKNDKLAGLKKNLASLFGKKPPEKKTSGSLMLMPPNYSASSLPSSGISFGEDFEPSTPRYIEGQNWLSRFLHIKPATKVLAFQVGRGRARQEIVRLLRDWKRFGVRDVKFDRATNIIQARVDKANQLQMKPVTFTAELFTVLQQGRRVQMCVGRFTQTRGAASSFRKVVDIIQEVLSEKGLIIEDEARVREVTGVLDG